ncbi:tetraspanin-31-like [Sycon ciliatum]|uniref:tetraspanin-31-like n=1 Tax=Sycon ciliatum TaxID=27933 RepID=UPI0020AE8A0E|eukprot:scpid69175/ scgid34039/ Tetraspanin-31
MAGTRKCSFLFFKYALVLLNAFYLLVGIILIAVAGAAKASAMFTSLSLLGGIVACGVFVLLVAILGLVGAFKHHQVLLFFYMISLLIIFLILFSVSVAVLALTGSQRHTILEKSWSASSNSTKSDVQSAFDCCGFDSSSRNATDNLFHPSCTAAPKAPACANRTTCTPPFFTDETPCCDTCYSHWQESIEKLVRSSGGVGLFFSFTVGGGMIFTYCYRNRKDPSVNPRAFL